MRKSHLPIETLTEAQEQKALFDWSFAARGRYPELRLLHHIPNGGRRDPIEARRLKEQGVKKGVPDICLPTARGGCHGLYIELKTEKGRVTPEQEWWCDELLSQGYSVAVCRGWRAAAEVITAYLDMRISSI